MFEFIMNVGPVLISVINRCLYLGMIVMHFQSFR